DGFQNVTQELSEANAIAEGSFLIVREEQAAPSPWFGGKTYVDLLRPGVTEQFLAMTLDTYKDHFASDFGGLIPGSFTDEPHLKPCGDIHWTPDLPEQYRQRWNEDFWDGLPHLREDTDEGRLFRHHYLCTLNELFVERWAKPYFNYCAKNNLEFTGHYWEHEWPNCASVPDNMSMSFWQQRPGIDTLFNQYAEGPHAQFGNVRAVIELASVARQGGRSRTLCEAYGGSSAEMRFEDYKRIGDWLQVLGVNTINEHLSDISIRGARKRDYPPTFSQHSPWMQSYHVLVDYFARISCALSQGKQINRCLILEPTTTAWMHHFTDTGRLDAIGEGFQAYVTKLAKAQLAFDLGSEAIVKETGT
ncbi:MAG TPA: glycosyl hydrolase, partial [Candidatus Hydrogenedentes bacterium]|nr:glycosyl hydrolase [Candidatus Hydrogenedentota bacterium]